MVSSFGSQFLVLVRATGNPEDVIDNSEPETTTQEPSKLR